MSLGTGLHFQMVYTDSGTSCPRCVYQICPCIYSFCQLLLEPLEGGTRQYASPDLVYALGQEVPE